MAHAETPEESGEVEQPMIATPIYDEVVKTTPHPATSVDTSFHWTTFAEAYAQANPRTTAPKPGQKPAAARKGRRGGRR